MGIRGGARAPLKGCNLQAGKVLFSCRCGSNRNRLGSCRERAGGYLGAHHERVRSEDGSTLPRATERDEPYSNDATAVEAHVCEQVSESSLGIHLEGLEWVSEDPPVQRDVLPRWLDGWWKRRACATTRAEPQASIP